MKTALLEDDPHIDLTLVRHFIKYLGIYLGSGVGGKNWEQPLAKYIATIQSLLY